MKIQKRKNVDKKHGRVYFIVFTTRPNSKINVRKFEDNTTPDYPSAWKPAMCRVFTRSVLWGCFNRTLSIYNHQLHITLTISSSSYFGLSDGSVVRRSIIFGLLMFSFGFGTVRSFYYKIDTPKKHNVL